MAQLTPQEIQKYLEAIKKALAGMEYGRVEIEVRGGHIQNVIRRPDEYAVLNGREVADP